VLPAEIQHLLRLPDPADQRARKTPQPENQPEAGNSKHPFADNYRSQAHNHFIAVLHALLAKEVLASTEKLKANS
jgi:hypothetical protein